MAERPLTLVAYTDATDFGGAEACLGNLLAALSEPKEVILVGTSRPILERLAGYRPGVAIRVLPSVRNKFQIGAIVAHLRAMRELRPDIVHVNLRTPYSCQYGLVAAVLTPGARVIAVEHLPLATASRFRRWLKRWTSSRLRFHVAVGDRAARLVEEDAGLEPGSVRTIHNGVPGPTAVSEQRLAEGAVIGSIGRLDRQKGYDVLIDAMPALPGVTAVIIGGGPLEAALREQAMDLAVKERVRLVGWSDEPRGFLSGFDVFVLPSRYEGFPLVILEAMHAGLAVVATDVGSVAECVEHGVTGLLVPDRDPDALAGALRTLLEDDELRQRMGAAALKIARERHTVERMAEQYEQLYAENME